MKIAIFAAAIFFCTQVSAFVNPVASKVTISGTRSSISSFTFIRGHRQGKSTTITWGVTSSSEITGFDIIVTYEDPTDPYAVWTTKGYVENGNNRSYKFIDNTDVFPGQMYYRVIAQTNNGSVISDLCAVRIVAH